ncbi:hypothetical protein AB9P05_15430 [Roseivirga sp. BDSF3-8]|uniref:hypothetical protein n=1 Tax=Roseivirga sp. BDSF3-8 TaxID=3241598 RepID=UPI003531F893
MNDQFKPYVHLFSTNLPTTNVNVNIKLRYRVSVDPAYVYHWRQFGSEEYKIEGDTRFYEIIGFTAGNPPAGVDVGEQLSINPGNLLLGARDFVVPSIINERKVKLSVLAGDGGGGEGNSTSYYIDADT